MDKIFILTLKYPVFQIMRHISCARSRTKRWVTVPGHSKPTAAPQGPSCTTARAGSAAGQKLAGRLRSQKLPHLLPPALTPPPLTHQRHALGPAQTEPVLLLLALRRDGIYGDCKSMPLQAARPAALSSCSCDGGHQHNRALHLNRRLGCQP